MTRILTIIALFFATPALAQKPYKGGDWVLIWDSSYAKYYIDRNAIQIDGDNIKFVTVQNDKRKNDAEHYLIFEEINCVQGKQRTINLTHWSKPYGTGKLLKGNNSDGKWQIFGARLMKHPYYGKLCE